MIYTTIKGKKYKVQFNEDCVTFIDANDKDTYINVSYSVNLKTLLQFDFF